MINQQVLKIATVVVVLVLVALFAYEISTGVSGNEETPKKNRSVSLDMGSFGGRRSAGGDLDQGTATLENGSKNTGKRREAPILRIGRIGKFL